MNPEEIRNCDLERVYEIASDGDVAEPFVAGRVPSGEQVLMGVLEDELLVALFFSPEGLYLRYDFFPAPYIPDPTLPPGPQRNRLGLALQDAKRKWMGELQMTPGTIRIHHFAFPEWKIGIAEWPLADFSEVQSALAAGEELEDEFLVEWRQQRRWVLIWKKELWMTADGEIGDT